MRGSMRAGTLGASVLWYETGTALASPQSFSIEDIASYLYEKRPDLQDVSLDGVMQEGENVFVYSADGARVEKISAAELKILGLRRVIEDTRRKIANDNVPATHRDVADYGDAMGAYADALGEIDVA